MWSSRYLWTSCGSSARTIVAISSDGIPLILEREDDPCDRTPPALGRVRRPMTAIVQDGYGSDDVLLVCSASPTCEPRPGRSADRFVERRRIRSRAFIRVRYREVEREA
jgi:hypothetical protein